MSIALPDLPYALDALEPHVSAKTLEKHYGAHHRGYVTKLNGLIEGTDYAGMDLDAIVVASKANGDTGVFNNAAQIWNHTFLWHSMSPTGGGAPGAELLSTLENSFSSIGEFQDSFRSAALGQFGSGWVWLVLTDGKLGIESSSNADVPFTSGSVPLLTLDVWEHAYYLDYQNERNRYVDAFLEHLLNWEFVALNLRREKQAA